ncbi:MAG: AAA family ATPase, partial [Myxococcales bacterium]|nr:AAA family ATPase [Myxococcales bacterium]
MRLERVTIRDFRNIENASFTANRQFVAFVGDNGQGKTNLLEALYFVCALRPLRNVTRRALLRHGSEEARLDLSVSHDRTNLVHQLAIQLSLRSRTLFKDDKKQDTKGFIGTAVAVSFTPEDLALGKGEPPR